MTMTNAEKAPTQPADLGDRLEELEQTHRATLNILEDFDEEKGKLALLQQATMNLLDDFDEERRNLQRVHQATLNLLEDMNEDRSRLGETQRAVLNILEDIEEERAAVEQAVEQLPHSRPQVPLSRQDCRRRSGTT